MDSRSRRSSVIRRIALAAVACAGSASLVACGSSSNNGADGGSGGGSSGSHDGGVRDSGVTTLGPPHSGSGSQDAGPTLDAFFAKDPPLMYCGFDGGTPPPDPTGTLECPSDKNREGCPCPTTGMTAACWPGLRADRDLGQCKDGTTTCVTTNEGLSTVWSACKGYVLPSPNATTGAAACSCFSSGQWFISNLSPCFVTDNPPDNPPFYAVSTYQSGDGGAQCPSFSSVPPPVPSQDWSTDSLTVDCEGHFKLCYTLKAGASANPQPSDCVVATVCTEADYTTANKAQVIPPLPGWSSSDSACATQFNTTGGYGEMTVQGVSEFCEKVDNGSGQPLVFNRVQYCPSACNSDPTGPGCANCMQGGSGSFQ